jgi:ABC-type glycerol-3-phosphate transport system substrate-binding protein
VDECKIRPKGVERSSKSGKGAAGLPVGFPYSISSFSEYKEAAWEFIAWATSEKAQLKQAMIGERADVTRKSVMEDKNYIKKYGYGNGDYLKLYKKYGW